MHGSENEFREQHPFQQVGSLTAAQAALGVTARDEDSVVALGATKVVIISVPFGTPALEFRVRSDGSDTNAIVLDFYAKPKEAGSALNPECYTRMFTLSCAQCPQIAKTSNYFADSFVITNNKWQPGYAVENTTDEIDRLRVNTDGYEKIAIIATTKTPTTVYIDAKKLDKDV